jgi:D-serine deaminase-like pyridoxal phosphate-dependent protein
MARAMLRDAHGRLVARCTVHDLAQRAVRVGDRVFVDFTRSCTTYTEVLPEEADDVELVDTAPESSA